MAQPARDITQPSELDQLSHEWEMAKAREIDAKAEREKIEEQILAQVATKEEGSNTEKTLYYKVTTTGRINRTVKPDVVEELTAKIPDPIMQKVFKYKPSLDKKGLDYLQNNEPDYYLEVSKAIVAKPGKTSVKVERIEQTN